MKLLFDENLSPRLPGRLTSLFVGSTHVHECGLGASDDEAIWNFAAANAFVLVSKDLDFYDRSLMYGNPPKVLWIRAGNCSTEHIEHLLRSFAREIEKFVRQADESVLVLP